MSEIMRIFARNPSNHFPMNPHRTIVRLALLFLLGFAPFALPVAAQAVAAAPAYRIVTRLDELPFKEVTDLVYDSDDLLWIATRNGLYAYDNTTLRPFRRDGRHPDMLSDNEVRRVAEDHQHRIWIATSQGLDRLDKHTGIIDHIVTHGDSPHGITELMTSSKGQVWVASDDGFYYFTADDDLPRHVPIIDTKGDTLHVLGQCILEGLVNNMCVIGRGVIQGYDLQGTTPFHSFLSLFHSFIICI